MERFIATVLLIGTKRFIEQLSNLEGLMKFFIIYLHLCVILKDLDGDGVIPSITPVHFKQKMTTIMKFKYPDQRT